MSFAVLMLFLMGASLVALGVQILQAPGWLALSLGCYTAAAALWGVLFPHLRASSSMGACTYRHQLAGDAQMGSAPPAYERAQEKRIMRMQALLESLCIAVFTPTLGWLIDRLGSVDTVLILVGLLFVLLLSLVLLISSLLSRLQYARSLASPRRLAETSRISWGSSMRVKF